tara:strand:+ start:1041 stop:1211 length:171 start_codon:yes stop_codon:yes gene_type:complete
MDKKYTAASQVSLFQDIDSKLLSGIQCSGNNSTQQNFFEKLRYQTEAAFINKKFHT